MTRGTYTVPTDWSIWLVYDTPQVAGEVIIRTWADNYKASDEWYIKNDWQPTGTSFVGAQKEDKLIKKGKNKEKEIIDELQK